MRHIPNILSGIRLLLVGVFIWFFMAGKYLPALAVFITAFLTDVLDGYLARHHNWVSDVGKLLDPLADKLMTIAALACICVGKHSGAYVMVFLVILIKELLMLIGGIKLAKKHIVVHSDWPGKIATGLFAIGITLALLSFVVPDVSPWDLAALYFAAGLSCFALIFYASVQRDNLFPKRGGK